jgi:hypothetical protein
MILVFIHWSQDLWQSYIFSKPITMGTAQEKITFPACLSYRAQSSPPQKRGENLLQNQPQLTDTAL